MNTAVGAAPARVMNVAVMVGVALLIALETQWRHGERLAKVAGVAALAFAVAIAFDAGLAPGLFDDGHEEDMEVGATSDVAAHLLAGNNGAP